MKTKQLILPIVIGTVAFFTWSFVDSSFKSKKEDTNYTKAFVDFDVFERITKETKIHRSERLISYNTFTNYAKDKNTIILDTRSKKMYDRMHIKGAVHLNFSDFTQSNLAELIPDKDTRILIYCNNNFSQEPLFIEPFPTKMALPDFSSTTIEKSYTLALNIPTFINLYGYGYRNVYELDELINTSTPNVMSNLEGTDLKQ